MATEKISESGENKIELREKIKIKKCYNIKITNFFIIKLVKSSIERLKLFYKFLIINNYGKCIVGVIFVTYISFSIYNALNIREGLELGDLVNDKSYYKEFIKDMFTEFNSDMPVMLIIYEPIDYSSKTIRKKVEMLLDDIRSIDGINKDFLINWMNYFSNELDQLRSNENPDQILHKIVNMSSPFSNDLIIGFNKTLNRTEIIASRFYVRYKKTSFNSYDAVIKNRLITFCEHSDLPVKAFSVGFKVTFSKINSLSCFFLNKIF